MNSSRNHIIMVQYHTLLLFFKNKTFGKIWIPIFYPPPPLRGVLKNENFENWSGSQNCKTWFVLLLKLDLQTKFQSCIFKIKRVIAIFHLSMWCEISISKILEILKLRLNFEISVRIFHVNPEYTNKQMLYSNMGSEKTPSLIS